MFEETIFPYDVFLSHSTKDKAVAREVAERLRKDGVRVWFVEWEIKPGDHIPSKIEEGLERSRILNGVNCSPNHKEDVNVAAAASMHQLHQLLTPICR